MSKKRKKTTNAPEAGIFKNSPFRTLKGFSPTSPAQASPKPEKARTTGDEDDAGLFLRSMDGVKRVAAGEDAAERPPVPAPGPDRGDLAQHKDAPDHELFLEAMGSLGTTALPTEEPEEEAVPARSSSSRARQLKKGTIRISEELDLHGFLKDEAIHRLEHFIKSASVRGQEAVLVITGKGLNSVEGPVLQGAVGAWLREKGKGMVAEFMAAPRDKGGSGAYVVYLKRQKR